MALIEAYYGTDEYKIQDKKIRDLLKESNKITPRAIFSKFIDGAATKAGEKTVELGLTFLTGGLSDLPSIIKKITG